MNTSTPSVETILTQAVDIATPDERRAFVEQACGGDRALQCRVEQLIANHFQAGSFLERPAVPMDPDGTTGWESARSAEGPGTVIGSYKLLEQIGEGGMGVVYVAEQTRPVRRRVALKIIKPGMDTKQVVARFEAERQALALMDHPNIARVHDGGATESGRPYFVMELVRGIPLTECCDREQLSIAERLELFVLVCRAVQHAHQKGIIHRDLKPSNVLVTVIDGAAVPKVIDFGVAKATGSSLTERTLYTGFHQFVGTPLYVSPEQADYSGMDIDTRSDIYSLGVLLYELLTGTTPFDHETFRTAAFDEMRRIIREDEPPKPSTRLSTLGESLCTVSERRKASPRRLSHEVRGELDWVVMKALEKDRRRRYDTANDFAADVMRHLTDKPVEACPPSPWYRFTKYARRNRAGLISAGLVVMALLIGTVVSAWAAVRATRAERRATAAVQDNRLVLNYLINDVFGAAAPEKSRGRTITVHDLLAAGETVIPARFGGRTLVEAAAREALGRAYYDLGRYEYDDAQRQFQRVAALRSQVLGPDHQETLAAEALLVRSLCPPGVPQVCKPNEAEPIARRVLQARRRVLGPAHPQTLASMTALAHVLWVKWMQALIEETRSPIRKPPDQFVRAKGSASLDEAQILLKRACSGQSHQLGTQHPETLETLDTLGRVLTGKADYAGAEVALRRAVEGRRLVLGPAHPETLQSLKYLGSPVRELGRNAEATQLFLESAEGHRQTFGPTHIQTSSAFGRLRDMYVRVGDTAAIRDLCERWLREILASPIDPDPYQHDRRRIMLGHLTLQLLALPERVPSDAELAARVGQQLVALGGRGGWTYLGAIHCRLGRLDEALQAFQTSAQQPDWTGGNDLYWFSLAVVHARRGDRARAKDCYKQGLAPDMRIDSWADIVGAFRAETESLLGMNSPTNDREKSQGAPSGPK